MEKYNATEVMKNAHRFYASRWRMGRSWPEILRLAWQWEQSRIRSEAARRVKTAEIIRNYQPSKVSNYNDKSIPQSAYYNPESRGHMGARYVGD